ncbi:MAG: outer membrane protein assembly factor BamC [Gammaproteobacteria bacterium]|nr:outer membrane protein assembly factor BamC [Gammaproteobacteria bacterium]
MKLIKLAALSPAVVLLNGCSVFFEQEQQQVEALKNRNSGLVVPAGLSNPKKSDEYAVEDIPAMSQQSDFSSPTTTLVIFEGSWLNPDDKHPAKIMLEKPALVDDLPGFVEQGITSFGELNNLTLTKNDAGYQAKQTVTEEVGFWFWEENVDVEGFTYQINVNFKPHGRSGEVSIETLDYQVIDEELAPNHTAQYRKETFATQSLNNLMLELDYLYRVKLKDERASLEISLSLVKNISGNYVISSQQDIKYVYSQLEDIIEELGFEIENEDDELYVYDTTFKVDEPSFWDFLGKDRSSDLNIEAGEYEIALATSTTGVNISFRNKAGTFLSQAQMENLFKIFMDIVKEEEAEL